MLSQRAVGLKAHKYAVCAAKRILTLPSERRLQPAATGEIVPLPRKRGVPILRQVRHRGGSVKMRPAPPGSWPALVSVKARVPWRRGKSWKFWWCLARRISKFVAR